MGKMDSEGNHLHDKHPMFQIAQLEKRVEELEILLEVLYRQLDSSAFHNSLGYDFDYWKKRALED